MANYTATDVATSAVEKVKYNATGVTAVVYSCALPNTLALNDTVTFGSIPANCTLVDIIFDSDDLDSNVTPTITWDVGISGTAAKFISQSTVSQAGGIARASVAGSIGYTPTSDTPVIATVHAAAATKVAGTVRCAILYTASP